MHGLQNIKRCIQNVSNLCAVVLVHKGGLLCIKNEYFFLSYLCNVSFKYITEVYTAF